MIAAVSAMMDVPDIILNAPREQLDCNLPLHLVQKLFILLLFTMSLNFEHICVYCCLEHSICEPLTRMTPYDMVIIITWW